MRITLTLDARALTVNRGGYLVKFETRELYLNPGEVIAARIEPDARPADQPTEQQEQPQ